MDKSRSSFGAACKTTAGKEPAPIHHWGSRTKGDRILPVGQFAILLVLGAGRSVMSEWQITGERISLDGWIEPLARW